MAGDLGIAKHMKTKIEEFEVLVPNLDGTGVAEKVKVNVPLCWDEEIKEWLLTPEAHETIDNTKARRMGLLLPAQMKELRERYDYSQKEMGEIFQVGEKSWTRWETGKHRPSRSINLLIRALYEDEISINYLLKRAGRLPRPDPDWSSLASIWRHSNDWQAGVVKVSRKKSALRSSKAEEQWSINLHSAPGKGASRDSLMVSLLQSPNSGGKSKWKLTCSRLDAFADRLSPGVAAGRIKFPSEA